ncbi:MAG: 4Fe-4S dicluster domain-containing protein [Chloroflexi bacterium]|nr:4Fe-4S dicluster domain-containing protein [Chloroflexota bacterium]
MTGLNKWDMIRPGWEQDAEPLLAAGGHDPVLGKEAAWDALRLVRGEISEEEFYQKHHQAYLNEFGADMRPAVSVGDAAAPLDEPNYLSGMSRRAALKLLGAGVAGLFFTSWWARQTFGASPEEKPPAGPLPVQMGMVVDLENCDGCLVCMAACRGHNGTPAWTHWMYVIAFEDENGRVNTLPRTCQHCSNAPCVKVCPVGARFKRKKDGLVLSNFDICIGCRYCQVSCPYGVNYFQWAEPETQVHIESRDYRGRWVAGRPPKGVMGKCTFCPERQDEEETKGTAVCALSCPHNALHFGDMNDPNSSPRRYLEQKKQEKGYISTFRLLEEYGTRPNVLFIGQRPSPRARPVEGPVPIKNMGFMESGRAVIKGEHPWFLSAFGGQ